LSAARGPLFFDTSVLLAGVIDFGERSAAPIALVDLAVERKIARAATAWHCCLELYSVATRLPEEYRLAPADAHRLLDEVVLAHFAVHDLPKARRATLFRDAASAGVAGGRVYDAQIGAVALASGATLLVTDNLRHFAGTTGGLRVSSSAATLADLRPGRK
jgi:predicted nucleic acid-binding protein